MSMRHRDRQRAILRKTHQFGETESQYEARIGADLERSSGLSVSIVRPRTPIDLYTVLGYTLRGRELNEPLIRVRRASLASAASDFDREAEKLRSSGVRAAGGGA